MILPGERNLYLTLQPVRLVPSVSHRPRIPPSPLVTEQQAADRFPGASPGEKSPLQALAQALPWWLWCTHLFLGAVPTYRRRSRCSSLSCLLFSLPETSLRSCTLCSIRLGPGLGALLASAHVLVDRQWLSWGCLAICYCHRASHGAAHEGSRSAGPRLVHREHVLVEQSPAWRAGRGAVAGWLG